MKKIICVEEKTEPIEYILKKVDSHCLTYTPGSTWPFAVFDDYSKNTLSAKWEVYKTIDEALEEFNYLYCNE